MSSIPYDPCHFDRDSDWRETKEFERRMNNRLCIECGRRLKSFEMDECLDCYLTRMGC